MCIYIKVYIYMCISENACMDEGSISRDPQPAVSCDEFNLAWTL